MRNGKASAVLFLLVLAGCFLLLTLSATRGNQEGEKTPGMTEIFRGYSSIEEKYEEYAPRLYHTLLSPTATRIVTTVSLAVSFILLIRTRNLRIFLPFFLLALFFAYIVPILQKFLTAR